MSKRKKVYEWTYRIIMFTILQSLIYTIGFVGLMYSIEKITELNLMTWKIQVGLIQVALAIAYLQLVNLFYWLFNTNLLDFKKLFKNKDD